MTDDEIPDWLKMFDLDAADIATADQNTSEARHTAAVLFTHYFSFNWALDNGSHLAALGHNLKFQGAFSELTQDKAMYAFAFLCELLCQELVAKFGTMEALIKAASDGTMFAASRESDESFELLKDLNLEG